ncbi:MAG TPA: glycine zipper 2TM domain-containing protein [Burkholderiaceae bacterium]|nr:glycine zipper 2TM domain-containing protein [Burkholderiaceae bacterium]
MKRLTLLAAALVIGSGACAADDKAKPMAVPDIVQGVRLATLCANCGVVSAVKTEKRKGKASGVGAVGGAVVGGVIGNKTTDSTTGTVVGGVAGGLIGNEIEKRTKRHTVWVTTATMKDGTVRKFEAGADPGWKAGAVIEVGADGQAKKR